MKVIKINKTNKQQAISEAIGILNSGGIVIYPTETCYGVGVDATNSKAVNKLLKYKRRPEGKAISIAVANEQMAKEYAATNETAKNIYNNLLPGPITVISRSLGNTIQELEAEDHTIGIRIPAYSFTLKLIKQFGKPITATSANTSGKKTPYNIQDILKHTSDKQQKLIDLVIDVGHLPNKPPSTVVNTTLNDLALIRKGSVDLHSTITNSEKETRITGSKLMGTYKSQLNQSCVIFALQGKLGAGKTQLTKGIANGLGIDQTITSPTYLLVKEYKLKDYNKLYHIDTWRMSEESELEDLGLSGMLKLGNVVVIEWSERITGLLDKLNKQQNTKVIWITIEHLAEQKRKISVLT